MAQEQQEVESAGEGGSLQPAGLASLLVRENREAKRRNDEVYHQRKWRGPGSLDSVNYAQGKIEKQEERLKTLEVFLAEQKKIFKGGGQEEPISFSPKP